MNDPFARHGLGIVYSTTAGPKALHLFAALPDHPTMQALRHEAWGATSQSCGSVSLPADAAVQQRRSGSWRSAPGVRAPTRWAFAWVALPGTLRQRSRVPPKLGPMAPTGAPSAWQHRARRPADTRRARPNWERDRGLARTVGSNRGGDADPDPTLACSRAAPAAASIPRSVG